MAYTRISDVVVPEIFGPYNRLLTETKSAFVQSGILVRDPFLDTLLTGGGLTFNIPTWNDLSDADAPTVVNDNPADEIVPTNIGTNTQVAIRQNRAKAWAAMNLAAELAGDDPMAAIGARTSAYWVRHLQKTVLATMAGVFADNDAAPDAVNEDQHTQFDMTYDISGSSYAAGVTDFSAEAFIDTALTAGDSADDFTAIAMHSVVYARMQKNNLIDFIPDARGETRIPTFLQRRVVVDDGMPNPSAGVFHTYIFGTGALRWGVSSPESPEVETERKPLAGYGSGADILINRVQWAIHPVGHAWVGGTTAKGGPDLGTGAGNLAHAGSWSRRFPERKQIKMARLITRES